MVWKQGTIKLAAAQNIFSQLDIQPIMSQIDPDRPIGYSALLPWSEERIQKSGLTALCQELVEQLIVKATVE